MNFFKHLHTVNKHRFYVFKNCTKCGIPFRGMVHDLSKYRPCEFFPSKRNYQGTSSPILEQRLNNGYYSTVAVNHTSRNKHHFEFWVDEFKGDIILIKMPYKYALEYVCDMIAASETYNKKKYNRSMPLQFFVDREAMYLMHPMTKEFVRTVLTTYSQQGFKGIKKKYTKNLFNDLDKKYKNTCKIEFFSKLGKFDPVYLEKDNHK